MKINAIRFKKNDKILIGQERELKGLIITTALFASGMIIGAGLYHGKNSSIELLNNLFNNYIIMRSESAILKIFINELTQNFIIVFCAFVSGLSCIGIPLLSIIVFAKGLGTGLLAGYLFSFFAINGMGYYLITIFPASVIFNSVFLVLCNNATVMSMDLLSIVLNKNQSDRKILIDYLIKLCPVLLFSFISSLISILLTKAFSVFFNFS